MNISRRAFFGKAAAIGTSLILAPVTELVALPLPVEPDDYRCSSVCDLDAQGRIVLRKRLVLWYEQKRVSCDSVRDALRQLLIHPRWGEYLCLDPGFQREMVSMSVSMDGKYIVLESKDRQVAHEV